MSSSGAERREHSDPKLTHQLAEMELIAKAGQVETDAVFKSFIPGGQGKPLPADKFDATGRLKTEGKIHDAWQSEQSKLKKDPDYQHESATFWMFYLMQNDTAAEGIKAINYKHLAIPEFVDSTPLNLEAKSIAKVANHFIAIDAKRLFEIGRGWPAFNTGHGNISLQLFKDPDAKRTVPFCGSSSQPSFTSIYIPLPTASTTTSPMQKEAKTPPKATRLSKASTRC